MVVWISGLDLDLTTWRFLRANGKHWDILVCKPPIRTANEREAELLWVLSKLL